MIISHRHKFAFFRSPKTGSVTSETILRMCGLFDEERDICSPISIVGFGGAQHAPQHMTPDEAIWHGHCDIDHLREYDCYTTFRDPFSRFLSAYMYSGKSQSKESFHHTVLTDGKLGPMLDRPQAEWFTAQGEVVCKPVMFHPFADNLRAFVKEIGGVDFQLIPSLNRTEGKKPSCNRRNWIDPYPIIVQKLKDRLSVDLQLQKELL